MNDTKKRILEAANSLFCENGYDNASMAAIAQRAGVTVALPYHYFKSKEDIVYAVLSMVYENNLTVMANVIKKGKTLGIEDFTTRCFDALTEIRPNALFVMHTILTPKLTERAIEIIGEFNDGIKDMFAPYFEGFDEALIEDIGYLLMSISTNFYLDGDLARATKAMIQLLKLVKRN